MAKPTDAPHRVTDPKGWRKSLGAKHIEIKPLTEDQVRKAINQNADNWLLPEFGIWGYIEVGGVYDLSIFQSIPGQSGFAMFRVNYRSASFGF